jgi:C-terminal processing protease CtpA/Prc
MTNPRAAAGLIAFLALAVSAAAQPPAAAGMVGLRFGVVGSDVAVLAVVPGSAAEAAGIAVGDKLLTVEDSPVGPMTLAQIVARFRGPAGTPVTASLQRGEAAPVEYRLVRRAPTQAPEAPVGAAPPAPGMVGLRLGVIGSEITVVETLADSPAADAGIAAGDKLLAVDGRPVGALTLAQAVDRLRGPAGTEVAATFQRGDAPPADHRLVRRALPQAAPSPAQAASSDEPSPPRAPRAARPRLTMEEVSAELLP